MALHWRSRAALFKGVTLMLMAGYVLISAGLAALADVQPEPILMGGVGIAALVAMSALLYGLLQVRAKRWLDVDASVPAERRQVNTFLLVALSGASVTLALLGQPWQLVLGLALPAAIIAVALVLSNVLKLSLHAAFAVFAAFLL